MLLSDDIPRNQTAIVAQTSRNLRAMLPQSRSAMLRAPALGCCLCIAWIDFGNPTAEIFRAAHPRDWTRRGGACFGRASALPVSSSPAAHAFWRSRNFTNIHFRSVWRPAIPPAMACCGAPICGSSMTFLFRHQAGVVWRASMSRTAGRVRSGKQEILLDADQRGSTRTRANPQEQPVKVGRRKLLIPVLSA